MQLDGADGEARRENCSYKLLFSTSSSTLPLHPSPPPILPHPGWCMRSAVAAPAPAISSGRDLLVGKEGLGSRIFFPFPSGPYQPQRAKRSEVCRSCHCRVRAGCWAWQSLRNELLLSDLCRYGRQTRGTVYQNRDGRMGDADCASCYFSWPGMLNELNAPMSARLARMAFHTMYGLFYHSIILHWPSRTGTARTSNRTGTAKVPGFPTSRGLGTRAVDVPFILASLPLALRRGDLPKMLTGAPWPHRQVLRSPRGRLAI